MINPRKLRWFEVPIGNIKVFDKIKIICKYMETLEFNKYGYNICIPSYFPSGTLIKNKSWNDVVSIECKIYSLTTKV